MLKIFELRRGYGVTVVIAGDAAEAVEVLTQFETEADAISLSHLVTPDEFTEKGVGSPRGVVSYWSD